MRSNAPRSPAKSQRSMLQRAACDASWRITFTEFGMPQRNRLDKAVPACATTMRKPLVPGGVSSAT